MLEEHQDREVYDFVTCPKDIMVEDGKRENYSSEYKKMEVYSYLPSVAVH